MEVSAIVYNDTGEGERWSVSWNDAGFRCSVSNLSEQDVADIRDQSSSHQPFPDQVDDQALFRTLEEAHAYFHHGTEQWRKSGADRLFGRIDPAKFPAT